MVFVPDPKHLDIIPKDPAVGALDHVGGNPLRAPDGAARETIAETVPALKLWRGLGYGETFCPMRQATPSGSGRGDPALRVTGYPEVRHSGWLHVARVAEQRGLRPPICNLGEGGRGNSYDQPGAPKSRRPRLHLRHGGSQGASTRSALTCNSARPIVAETGARNAHFPTPSGDSPWLK